MDKNKRGGGAAQRGGRGGRGGSAPGSAQATAGGASTSGRGSSLAVRGGVSKRGRGRGASGGAEEDVDVGSSFKGLFNKDLRIMMFGFGDNVCPLDETVDLVEDIVLEYMKEATLKAAAAAADALKPKMDEKDLLFSVRKEPAKFARVKELLTMQQVIKEARNSFKEVTAEDEEEAE